ncbi:DNA repair protein RadC [Rheinheimera pacifica]|uniref:JAB domain-containing protein n=1 Tax=Rheinheimera pacifica TaxID=173990 RepID=UPI002166CB3B|nr:JAB domain-containing protein [Rheinheimera pacifica]MCS4309673.1 DNA repair protein RadC [Rheinheimera pacifica]
MFTKREQGTIDRALAILASKAVKTDIFIAEPGIGKRIAQLSCAGTDREHFGAMWLTSAHQLIQTDILSIGTVSSAAVYPREVVKMALKRKASAVVFFHNHPGGTLEASRADRNITERLSSALMTIDIKVLDHFIVTELGVMSFAERGLL